jgi:hypothetical protein
MTASTTGREVDASAVRALRMSYKQLVKAGGDSVRASWRFGQCIDSFTDHYHQRQLADAMDLSVSTIARYLRFYRAYQRPELAVAASEQLETYNIDIITELQTQLHPIEHGRPYAGRRFRYRCQNCQHTDVKREEITDPDELAALRQAEADDLAKLAALEAAL